MIGGIYPAQTPPGQIGRGAPVAASIPAAALGGSAAALVATIRAGISITFATATATAQLLPRIPVGYGLVSGPPATATAGLAAATLAGGRVLPVALATAGAAFLAGGAGTGATFPVDPMIAGVARFQTAGWWVITKPGVLTVVAPARRLTVIAQPDERRGGW